MKSKYEYLNRVDDFNRWYLNVRTRSPISADIWRRNLGYYCEWYGILPKDIVRQAVDGSLKNNFQDFVLTKLEMGGRGAAVSKYKDSIRSWLNFNDIEYKFKINIPNEKVNETTLDESVPTREEVAKFLRKANVRGRASISLMAFSGLRPESLGNYEGTDGLTLEDLEDFDLENMEFKKIPCKVNIRHNLSKACNRYFTLLSQEGCRNVVEYLEERKKIGESLTKKSPLMVTDSWNTQTHLTNLRTSLVTRDIREAIRSSGHKMRPYILRAYFATALDIAESKSLISHPWRQFIMGHKGDIEATYSTNKKLLPEMVENMRESYRKASKYFVTEGSEIQEESLIKMMRQYAITNFEVQLDMQLSDDQKEELMNLREDEYQERLRQVFHKKQAEVLNNGNKQKIINVSEIESFIDSGWEFVSTLPGEQKAIVKLPD